MMDKNSRKVGSQYELSLQLHEKQVAFPQNRLLAEKRLQHLQTFMKNPDFFTDYKGFIKELTSKSYARMKKRTSYWQNMVHSTP